MHASILNVLVTIWTVMENCFQWLPGSCCWLYVLRNFCWLAELSMLFSSKCLLELIDQHHLHFNECFAVWPRSAVSLHFLFSFLPSVAAFNKMLLPSSNHQCQSSEGHSNQWKSLSGFIVSSFSTGLVKERGHCHLYVGSLTVHNMKPLHYSADCKFCLHSAK